METILNKIFREYSERNQQTANDKSKTTRKKEEAESVPEKLETSMTATVIEQCHRGDWQLVENAQTSVIKFVGKTTAPIDIESEMVSEWNTFECGVEMPTYQPLTLDPIPQMEPLPLLTTHNNSNLSVYRQLLSPYLRRTN